MEVFTISTFISMIYYSISCFYIYYNRKLIISPVSIFIIFQIVMYTGIMINIDHTSSIDIEYLLVYLISLVMFIIGTCLVKKGKKEETINIYSNDFRKSSIRRIYSLIILSIFICVWFFIKIGGNIFLKVLLSFFTKNIVNITEDRFESSAVIGVGYIYQFRIVILPILSIICLISKHKYSYFLFIIMLIFSLGTGQRGGFVTIVIIFFLSILLEKKITHKKILDSNLVLFFVLAFFLFAVMTIANGRVLGSGSLQAAILDRVFHDNQVSAIAGWRYVYQMPIQFGRDWLMMLKDILPGKNDYLPLSRQIFSLFYGTTRGTAPPCIWTSVYYNWGIIGILYIPLIMGFIYKKIETNRHIRNPIELVLYVAMSVLLGTWIADSPMSLINTGVVTLVILKKVIL